MSDRDATSDRCVVVDGALLRVSKNFDDTEGSDDMVAMHELVAAVKKSMDADLPNTLCGAVQENATPDSPAWGRCVFLKLHEGKHSWDR